MKKIFTVLVILVIGAMVGSGAVLALEFFEGGGSIEELKEYVKGDIIPSVVNVITILSGLYIGSQKLRNNMSGASDGLLAATAQIGSVSQVSAATQAVVEQIGERLLAQIKQNESQRTEIEAQRALINAMNCKIEIMQQMIATGFGNIPELVKSGNARTIYALMEGGEQDEAEG